MRRGKHDAAAFLVGTERDRQSAHGYDDTLGGIVNKRERYVTLKNGEYLRLSWPSASAMGIYALRHCLGWIGICRWPTEKQARQN